ncbi:methionyl-tRNA synthetase [Sphingomonas guangdongensis]|uniref:Methionine--tRNA ligase n=1 Tax=Sphingomonas guangdongensis TaxID=1141890 RepID=A0A285R160_9SPHN|nr:methionine--tRNA ligase [Sphingomonas guangdongensis]SOB87853.1 methionyl-tRNA synthetase [Sphingomonas guangdongensis]
MADPYYITTAIHYPNGRPHIGHAYEMIAADAIARFHRQTGRPVRFQTGTDEHGLKMVKTARDRGIAVRALADEMSSYFNEMADVLNISYDRFIRTVEPDHYRASQAIWAAMAEAGDLYLDRYEGWYSVRDEAFYEEKELVAGPDGTRLSPQGTPVEWTAEETWFFRLSRHQQPLLDFYAANPDFIRPESRRNEILRFVEGGLADLSVSRTSFDWGVPVEGSPGHVMYVWVDALTNYLTGAGYPDDPAAIERWWPADLHLIGKDIVRFHAVYWPAFLMSAALPLPKQVFGHGFLLNRGEKMSKSVGNVVDPMELARLYGVDALRYFLLRDVSFGQDGTFSDEAIVTRANADLANSFGNLAQRTLAFIAKNLDGRLDDLGRADPADAALLGEVKSAADDFAAAFTDLALSQGIEAWMRGVFACNAYIDTQAPWTLRKTDPERMRAVLATLVRAIRDLAIVILPVVPDAAGRILDQLGVETRDHAALRDAWNATAIALDPPSPVFPRLELAAA